MICDQKEIILLRQDKKQKFTFLSKKLLHFFEQFVYDIFNKFNTCYIKYA